MITLKFILKRLICKYVESRIPGISHWLSIDNNVRLPNPCIGWNYKLDFWFQCTIIKYLFAQQLFWNRSWIYYLFAEIRLLNNGYVSKCSTRNIVQIFCVFNCQVITWLIIIWYEVYCELLICKKFLQILCVVSIYLSHVQIGRRRIQYCIPFQCIK